jgi:hypothetical protein
MDSMGDLPRPQCRHREEPAALAEGDRGVLAFAIDDYYQAAASLSRSAAGQTGLWPDWDRHLARVAAAKAELLELMREQMDEAHGAAKVSDLWLGPMEAEFRTRRGRRGE